MFDRRPKQQPFDMCVVRIHMCRIIRRKVLAITILNPWLEY